MTFEVALTILVLILIFLLAAVCCCLNHVDNQYQKLKASHASQKFELIEVHRKLAEANANLEVAVKNMEESKQTIRVLIKHLDEKVQGQIILPSLDRG